MFQGSLKTLAVIELMVMISESLETRHQGSFIPNNCIECLYEVMFDPKDRQYRDMVSQSQGLARCNAE
jgi:hypothetical protein